MAPVRPIFKMFGSSIVQYNFEDNGWGAILAHTYARKADIVLRGYAGWNSNQGLQVLDKVFPKDADVQPSLAIVYFGGNDSMPPRPDGTGPHVPLDDYIENMTNIAEHVKSLSEEIRIIFLSAPALSEKILEERWGEDFKKSGITNERRRVYSDAWVQKCNELGFKVVDMWTALQQPDDWDTVCFTDGLHLSEVGSKLVAKEIKRILREADWKPSLDWELMPTEFPDDSVPPVVTDFLSFMERTC